MTAELIHIGAVLAVGGIAGSYWAGLRTGRVWWLLPAYAFLILTAAAAGWQS